ncbi:hypothetical protein CPB83DRAFT_821651 [Crepidotus variabilis]|uniref:NACHT domain-containing protein n=1 Tax=Crepidotus variabilis TaxID=179855 RepID=A0A9P6JJT0_9AGAR|nr:hypothetical protein CPB83DRAFT_821651 [Crepidotus variabilis]
MSKVDFFSGAHDTVINNATFTVAVGSNIYAGLYLLYQSTSKEAAYDSARADAPARCLSGTRRRILGDVHRCNTPILFLVGPAGSGKSAIALTVCEQLRQQNRLGANFFFLHLTGRNSRRYIFTTIAYQLANSQPALKSAIDKVVYDDPAIVDKDIDIQLERLIVKPILEVGIEGEPIVVVLDGLDECEDDRWQLRITQLLAFTLQVTPIPLRFFITCRPKPWHETLLSSPTKPPTISTIVLNRDSEVDQDIRLFYKSEFYAIAHDPNHRDSLSSTTSDSNWPSEEILDELVTRASGLFVYASTITRFVGEPSHRPIDRLDDVLSHKPSPNSTVLDLLNTLYPSTSEISHGPAPVNLYRCRAGGVTDHFYTTDLNEYNNATQNLNYIAEGVACKIFDGTGKGLVPLYRLYHHQATDHFYTMSTAEVTRAVGDLNYVFEGIAGYVYPMLPSQSSAIPLFRLWNGRLFDHFFTTSLTERNEASYRLGFDDEGIAAYVLPP